MLGQNIAPIYGASHAVYTVAIRTQKLLASAVEPGKTDLLESHIRKMNLEAFGYFWESHAIEILGYVSEIRHDNPEAREIFLIAVKHHLSSKVNW